MTAPKPKPAEVVLMATSETLLLELCRQQRLGIPSRPKASTSRAQLKRAGLIESRKPPMSSTKFTPIWRPTEAGFARAAEIEAAERG